MGDMKIQQVVEASDSVQSDNKIDSRVDHEAQLTTTVSRTPEHDMVAKEESESERIERLGRERPPQFRSPWSEFGFCLSIMLSQMMAEYFISGFTVLLPTLSNSLHLPPSSSTWPASAFSLVAGSTLLLFGRLSDLYGGHTLYLLGLAWHTLLSLLCSFSPNATTIDLLRALQGLGPAAYLPAAIMLLGTLYRPGPRKNLVFSLYGACAPLGFFLGIFVAGIAGRWGGWRWYFWIGSGLTFFTTVVSYLSIPSDYKERRELRSRRRRGRNNGGRGSEMDFAGAGLIVCGLILVVFALTQSSRAPSGWRTPYIPVLFAVGMLLLGVAVWYEGWRAKDPLLPLEIFNIPGMKALVAALFLSYGVLGSWLFYATFYMQEILSTTPLQTIAWYIPFGLGGLILPTLASLILHIISGTALLIFSAAGWVIAALLFAIIPIDATISTTYWAYIFPAMICGTIGIDITYNIANIFVTTNLTHAQQGLAGALLWSLMFLGISFSLGFADIVFSRMEMEGVGKLQSYRAVFWYMVGCAGVSLVLVAAFVRVGIAGSDMTADEKQERSEEAVSE